MQVAVDGVGVGYHGGPMANWGSGASEQAELANLWATTTVKLEWESENSTQVPRYGTVGTWGNNLGYRGNTWDWALLSTQPGP